MCYSALVKQNIKQLSFQFKARIDYNAFLGLFESRLKGEKIAIPKALEHNFTSNPESLEERKIRDLILEYRQQQGLKDEQELIKQQKRLVAAEQALLKKPTKKAAEEQRIAFKKIDWYNGRALKRASTELIDDDFQIFPLHYAPFVRMQGGDRIIEPRRYLLRPRGQLESFDRKYNGCYNAREDSLENVFFWQPLFGRNHGLLVIAEFFENVPEHLYEKRELKPGEEAKNIVLRFRPKDVTEMYVPCVFDDWEDDQGRSRLRSFALITTEPPEEIASTGHNRCPIFMKRENVDHWLSPKGRSLQDLHSILGQRQTPYYEHSIVLVA